MRNLKLRITDFFFLSVYSFQNGRIAIRFVSHEQKLKMILSARVAQYDLDKLEP